MVVRERFRARNAAELHLKNRCGGRSTGIGWSKAIPSHDAFSRVFRLFDPERVHLWFFSFVLRFAETCRRVVAIDGKTVRLSFDQACAHLHALRANVVPTNSNLSRAATVLT